MAKKIIKSYTFTPGNPGTIEFRGNYLLSDLLLITNTTDNQIIYNFSDSTKGATVSSDGNNTIVTLNYDTSSMSAQDSLQIFVDGGVQLTEPSGAFRDPVDKARVSNPESLIDTDFEYSLQPTKWETVQLQANIPGLYQKANEPAFTAEQIVSILPSTFETQPSASSIPFDDTLRTAIFNTVRDRGGIIDDRDRTNQGTAIIPFNVTVNGFTFNEVRSNSEGVVQFGTAQIPQDANGITANTYGSAPLIKLFAQDMGVIRYEDAVRGSSPNREYIFKYTGDAISGDPNNPSQIAYLIFQESDGSIQVHYERNGSTGTVGLFDPRTPETLLTWAPQQNSNSTYLVSDAYSLNITTTIIEGLEITVDAPPTIPFENGTPIIFKETQDPVYLDRAFLITSVTSPTSFTIVPESPIPYVGEQKTPYTVLYTGGFFNSSELIINSLSTVTGTRRLRVNFATNHSLFVGSSIYVIDPSSVDTDWIGSFTVSRVISDTEIEYLGASTGNYVGTTILNSAGTKVYIRNNGSALHRYFDGGVQISPENYSPNCQIIRQTRRYFRYQSGKGIQFSTGILFKPVYDIFEYTVDSSGYDPITNPFYEMTITTDQIHGFNLPGQYKPAVTINMRGFLEEDGAEPGANFPYNLQEAPITGITGPKTFTINIPIVNGTTPTLNPGGLAYVEVVGWRDAVVRSGLFDQQNGLFFEHDGVDLSVVRRNSTTQLSGLCNIDNNSSLLRGVGSRWKTQLKEGDFIVIKGVSYYVTRIVDDNRLTIAPDYIGADVANIKIVKTIDFKINREDFNLDKLDGTGPSGYVFNPSKMQMVFMDYSWYGAGKVRFGMRGVDGDVFYCHEIINNNTNTEAFMRSGNLPARFEINTISKSGKLKTAIDDLSRSVVVDEAEASVLPDSGTIIINNEYIEYSKGSQPTPSERTLDLVNRNVGFLSTGPVSAAINDTWLSNNQNFSPTLAHWGVSVIMDGTFNVDKSYLFTATNSASKQVLPGVTTPLLTIRLAPSVDYGVPGFYGIRNLINRSVLTLQTLRAVANGQYTLTAKINGESTLFQTEANWLPAGNGSIAQYIDHTDNTEVQGGDVVGIFLTDEGVNRGSSSTFDISEIRGLSNSILGGPNSFPDGPDTLTIFATNNSAQAGTILGNISWTESQG